MPYQPAANRYQAMVYRRCGRSGLQLPAISLGLWNSFGEGASLESVRGLLFHAFDLGITHFDLANNYGPPPGAAEESLGRVLTTDLAPHRDELIISTKAGYPMWPGPYGEWGSRKYLLASLEQSLRRLRTDYVDIFYSHRFDPDTPLEETMGALVTAVQRGKALYVGVSSYSARKTAEAAALLRSMGVPCVIHQPSYSMLNRWIEEGLLEVLGQEGIGCIAFSPLAQGMLTDKYLRGIPGGVARGPEKQPAQPRVPVGGEPGEGAGVACDCRSARTDPRPDGAGLVSPRSPGDLGPDRRERARAADPQCGGARAAGLPRRGARRDRPVRDRVRDQPLGPIQPGRVRRQSRAGSRASAGGTTRILVSCPRDSINNPGLSGPPFSRLGPRREPASLAPAPPPLRGAVAPWAKG